MKSWTKITDQIAYIAHLARLSVAESASNRIGFWLFAVMMFLNNIVYFAMWAIYFYNFSTLRGWTLTDFAVLQGICSFAFGVSFFFCGGSWNIARLIVTGNLDSFLGRPRSVLLAVLMSECRASTLGDIASAFVLWLVFGKQHLVDLPLLILLSTAAAAIFLAAMIVMQSIAFWASSLSSIGDTLYEVFITLALYPQNLYGRIGQIALLTVIPAAYIGLLPVEIMRHFSWGLLLAVLAAGVFYLWLAAWIFNRGLRLYKSGNLLQR